MKKINEYLKSFKFNAHEAYRFKSQPRSKKAKEAGELTGGVMSAVHEYLAKEEFGIESYLENDAMTKGKMLEDKAIELLNKAKDKSFKKNKETLSNDFAIGTPDIIDAEAKQIRDIKTPEKGDSFPFYKFGVDIRKSRKYQSYYWQLQTYMWLAGEEYQSSFLDFCLVNSPQWMQDNHLRKASFHLYNFEHELKEEEKLLAETKMENAIQRLHVFDDIPTERRVVSFLVHRNEKDIEKLKENVINIRNLTTQI